LQRQPGADDDGQRLPGAETSPDLRPAHEIAVQNGSETAVRCGNMVLNGMILMASINQLI